MVEWLALPTHYYKLVCTDGFKRELSNVTLGYVQSYVRNFDRQGVTAKLYCKQDGKWELIAEINK